MVHKPHKTIEEQIELLKSRGMEFRDEVQAQHFLRYISYYRLKGYWWDAQIDFVNHCFKEETYFEDILDRYTFDRRLRLILMDGIERIEVSLRTQLIYHVSQYHGPLWYQNSQIFSNPVKHADNLSNLMREFDYSQEIFIKDHKNKHPNSDPESWKIMEIASMGTLSKFYKLLNNQLPAKTLIANDMGLNFQNELSSWLLSITYIRNIAAHHSRIYGRDMVFKPKLDIRNPKKSWLNTILTINQMSKAFSTISCIVFLCNQVTPGHQIKSKIIDLIDSHPVVPIENLGFSNGWRLHPIWS